MCSAADPQTQSVSEICTVRRGAIEWHYPPADLQQHSCFALAGGLEGDFSLIFFLFFFSANQHTSRHACHCHRIHKRNRIHLIQLSDSGWAYRPSLTEEAFSAVPGCREGLFSSFLFLFSSLKLNISLRGRLQSCAKLTCGLDRSGGARLGC